MQTVRSHFKFSTRFSQPLHVVLTLVFSAAYAQAADRGKPPLVPTTDTVRGTLTEPTGLEELRAEVRRWTSLPPFMRAAIAGEIGKVVSSDAAAEFTGPRGSTNYALDTVHGRALWALAQLTGVWVPAADAIGDARSRRAVQAEALRLALAYRNAVISMASEPDAGPQNAPDLAKAYKGRIRPGTSDSAQELAAVMWEFLVRWRPLGRKVEELKAIAGDPTRITGTNLKYDFDTGFGGKQFVFLIEEGRIVEVQINSME